ncbi:hypothetical protein [Actinophytocola sp.]|uniref:hypothetical protein n=1 Tax=Actinophytocola sp. TaxID=1872138 RepID=UPI003D6A0310
MTPEFAEGPDAPLTDEDAEILAGVRQLWEVADPMPPGLVDQVQFAIDLDRVDEAVELEVSRLVEVRELAAARSDELTRLVTFQCDSLSIMITMEPRADGTTRIDGWLTPGASHRIELRSPARTMSTESDDTGRFALDAVPAGIVQLVVHVVESARRIITPTMEI